ncbi:MAG: aminopeptidase P family protein [Clostridia bacterium]|nr:aminopeptidase P family protein [Clostridia bacterium]
MEKLFEKTEAIVVTGESNRYYLTRFKCSFGVVVLLPQSKILFTDFRYAVAAKKSIKDAEVRITDKENLYSNVVALLNERKVKVVGYEDEVMSVASFKAFKKAFADFDLKPIGNALETLRSVKTEEEIEFIKQAQSITETVLDKVLSQLKVGATEKEINAELTYQFILQGADGLAFDNIVAFGENSADCHHIPGDRKLERGDIVLFDIGAKWGGYCSDMTRTFCYGEPSQKIADLHSMVLSAQEYVLKHVKAGMTGREVDGMAREFFKANGYDKEFGHSLGHGVGVDIHELPTLSSKNEEPLAENAVVTIEPGLYIEGFGGVRIEDMVVIKKDGIENLTNYTKSLII